MSRMSRGLRVCLTLSGGASLGAFQAGACAALLAALECVRDEHDVDVRVDAIGGASAGSIVGLMVAHSLLEGVDGPDVLNEAWVERVGVDTLLRGGARGPLSLKRVGQELPELLERGTRGRSQRHPLVLHVALTGLRGLTYDIHGLRKDEPVTAVTYADWKDFRLQPGGGVQQLLRPRGSSPLETVLASASHPGAFAPRKLDRRPDFADYERQGITNLPRSGRLWYSDGGQIQSEPLGRVVAAARALDDGGTADAHRLNLLIDPRSEEPSDAEEWSDDDYDGGWAHGLSRALSIASEQSLYDDLRKIERDNYRLDWIGQLAEVIDGHVAEDARDGLSALLERIAEHRRRLRSGADPEPAAPLDDDATATELLRQAIEDIGGLKGKQPVAVDVISPLVLANHEDGRVAELLAGELLGDFGGFLDRDLRRSDFALGYESTLAWCPDGLASCDLPDRAVEAATDAVRQRRPDSWENVSRGRAEQRDLPWRARLRLARILLRAGRALLR
jgi:predicted acylesterase/phospholipase RssA